MLRSFRVTNHRSFRDEQELLLIPAYRSGAPVVPVAAVFGANASGKSNLLDALAWMRDAVLDSYRSWEPESGIPRNRFRLDPTSAAKSSGFVVDLLLDGVQFVYGFSASSLAIEEEWLHTYPHGRDRVVFERHGRQVELGSTVPERRGRAELLESLLRDNALLLSTAVQAGQPEVRPVYRWFRDGLRMLGARRASAGTLHTLADQVLATVTAHPEFVDLLRLADLGINSIEVTQWPADAAGVRELWFRHGPDDIPLGLGDQSHGTLAWIEILLAAVAAIEDGALLATDEIDASLHPRLTARLIELFHSPDTNPRGAQLLFTTHDATLLGTSLGEEVLRRDEIWFVEKQDGASRLYPLSDFHPRTGENRERRYLAGSYGAVPAIFENSLVESVLATGAEPADDPS